MTTQEKRRVLTWLLTAIAIPLASWAFMRYDASKLDVSRYEREQAGVNGKLDRILDAICESNQTRVCR